MTPENHKWTWTNLLSPNVSDLTISRTMLWNHSPTLNITTKQSLGKINVLSPRAMSRTLRDGHGWLTGCRVTGNEKTQGYQNSQAQQQDEGHFP